MSLVRGLVLTTALGAGLASPLLGQGSVFSLRGLGWSGRPVSARTAATAGALAMFDPTMSINPAAAARWRSVAAWGVGAPTQRSFEGPSGPADQQTVRFPLLGFAAVLPPRAALSFSVSDYLDRTWTLTTRDSITLRGVTEPFTDAGRSIGGISDMALSFGYRVREDLHLGIGLHYYLGSTRLTSQRLFDNTAYSDVLEQSLTDYRAVGAGAGLTWIKRRVDVALSGRVNGALRSGNSSGDVAHTNLPWQFAAGLRIQPVPGVFVAGSAEYNAWSRANAQLVAALNEQARDVWSVSLGAEIPGSSIIGFHTPLRLGYRWRQLPFTSLGTAINESAVAGGIGFSLARDRTTIDLGAESGSRSSAGAKETFQSLFVGLTIRP